MEKISQRVKALMQEQGLKIKPLAQKAGIDQTHLSRMLRGIRKWSIPHLQAVARALNVQIGDLTDEIIAVPVIGEIDALSEVPYPGDNIRGEHAEYTSLPLLFISEGKRVKVDQLYALRVKDDGFEPFILKGAKLIIERGGEKAERDLVVYCSERGLLHIGRLFFHDDSLLLRSLNPRSKDLILPRRHLASMDRVVGQIFV
jgi:SOS-response transcriptional repressor LexA